MHFTRGYLRLFNSYQEETTYMIDFQAAWFSKFISPDPVLNQQIDVLQIVCNREVFLQSFNILDDNELEFLIELKDKD